MSMRTVSLAAVGSLLLCSSAWGAPISSSAASTQAAPTQVEEVGRKKRHFNKHRHFRRGYNHRRHDYRRAPRGWHRYDRRPDRWRTRGCITIGPIWFCP
jgi:Ni/Co efflux regulator RcnB